MPKFSLVYDGFSVPEAQAAEETAIVLAQALNIEQAEVSKLLSLGSGTLKESEDQVALDSLSELCSSLGLRCTVTFGIGETNEMDFASETIQSPSLQENSQAEQNAGESDHGLSLSDNETDNQTKSETPATQTSGSSESSALLVDELVDQLQHNSYLQDSDTPNRSQVESLIKEGKTSRYGSPSTNSEIHANDQQLESEEEASAELLSTESDESNNLGTHESSDSTESSNEVTEDPLASASVNQFDWGQTDALTFVKKSKRTDRLVDLATISVIAFLVALLGYFVNHQSQFEERIQEQQRYVDSLLKNIEAEQKSINDESVAKNIIPSAKLLTGSAKADGWQLDVECFTDDAEIKSLEVKIETPPPPNLTDDEIINKVQQRPWLRRILVSNLAIKQKENRKFIATGKARAFIEQDETKLQSLGEVVITGEMSEKQTEITGRMMINRGLQQIPQGDQIIVESAENGDYKYFVGLPISAKFRPIK